MRMNRLQASLEGENYESLASNFEAFCLLCESLPVHNNARNDLLLRDRILSIFRDELASAISKYEVDQVFISLFLLFENSYSRNLQVLRIGFLFPKIGLREEGFKRVSMYLGSVFSWITSTSVARLMIFFYCSRSTHVSSTTQSPNHRLKMVSKHK